VTDIKAKALALVNEVFAESGGSPIDYAALFRAGDIVTLALLRAIEQHEAYQQKVSDAVGYVIKFLGARHWAETHLKEFIIPAPKPDPLVEALVQVDFVPWKELSKHADDFRAALDALGFEIREKGQ
jgi:hypothetical protein